MSREGAGDKKPTKRATGGTPIWVWVVYGLGILGASIFVLSLLFSLGAYISDVAVTLNVSARAIVLWGGLMLLALVIWARRRRSGRKGQGS